MRAGLGLRRFENELGGRGVAYRPLAEAMAPISRTVALPDVPAPFRTALSGIVVE